MAMTLVYVDDEDPVREAVTELLRMSGTHVIDCRSGAAAIRVVAIVAPDAVLVDLNMPEMDGFEVARSIRRTEPELRLVAFSGQATIENKQHAMRAGFDCFVAKPAAISELLAALGAPDITHP